MPLALLIAVLALFIGFGVARANTYLSQPQAIELAFAKEKVERKTAFLTTEQAAKIESLSGVKPSSRLVTYYVARSSAGVTGVALFDKRIVRTLPITYMAALTPAGEVERVEVMQFDEPEEYLPPPRWLALYRAKPLTRDLTLGRSVPRITGASLTSQAMNDGLRLILATFQVAVKPKL